jgi:Heparinase II/III-like protein
MRFLRVMMVLTGVAMAEADADPHPRLLFPAAREVEVKERIAADPLAAEIQKAVVKRAEQVLKERTCEYLIPDGKRLLSESRKSLHHVLYCGWAWRTTGDIRFRDRVIRELDAACSLKDWNPSHFLDTAEMSTAVAIGYDWLFPALNPEQRKRYEDTLLDKGLRVVGKVHPKTAWWTGATNNWSQVCGTGMALAAEAVKERDPELCAALVKHGDELIAKCERFYLPDGAYPEGPSYWHYGTNYHVMLLAARESLGQPVKVPAVLRGSGDFMTHVVGPTGTDFNFADGNAGQEVPSPAQSWIATKFKDTAQAGNLRGLLETALKRGIGGGTTNDLRFFPLHLLWLPEAPAGKSEEPLSARFEGEQSFVFLRNGWTPEAAWLAIKGGTGAANHGHLDAGSFVYEAGGRRWFHDLGSDNYNMPGYFGKQRWDYLRLNNFSHNTLVIDGKLQAAPKEGCEVSVIQQDGTRTGTVVDLGRAYQGQAGSVKRSAVLDAGDGSVRLTDTIEKPAGPVRWAVVTKAKPKIEGNRVILEEEGKRLLLTRHDKAGGKWEEYSLKPNTKEEKQNGGFRMIGFTAPKGDQLVLEVGWKLAAN